ncbi:unnamed protein product [Durusdinium trenchii]|uniref:Uncharacterized protein n=1 Tax=Durusdinium trenchii TaxID=1381693 RepID=A0ABP0KBH5_9DINO
MFCGKLSPRQRSGTHGDSENRFPLHRSEVERNADMHITQTMLFVSVAWQKSRFQAMKKLALLLKNPRKKKQVPDRLSLRDSPLARTAAEHIGKGAAASLLQKFAKAAVLESGEDHVSASTRWAARLGNHRKRTYHTEDTFHKALSRSDDAIIKCPISYVVIPVVDKQAARALRRKPNKKRRFNVRNAKNTKGKKHQPTKSGAAPQPITQKKWPVMNPRVMLDAVAKAGANHLLEGDDFDWLEFWEAANSEPWGRLCAQRALRTMANGT